MCESARYFFSRSFLTAFIPILCLSASLPSIWRENLQRIGYLTSVSSMHLFLQMHACICAHIFVHAQDSPICSRYPSPVLSLFFRCNVIFFLCRRTLRMRFPKELKECISRSMLYKSWFPREKIERGKTLLCPRTPSSDIPFFSSVLRRMYVISFSRNPDVGSTVLIITDHPRITNHVSPILRNRFHSTEGRIIDLLLFYDCFFELITRTLNWKL